ncbi:MAG: hypothetical protein M3454_04985 [Actinomycetota bacterium]|nr:hypothetical protein [Actinomycetota bacterium]
MTEDKARKRSIRTRMSKTGERYTAARRHVVNRDEKPTPRLTVDLGKSEEAIKRGSGKTWDEWFAILDEWGATKRTHGEIARHVHEEHDVSGWWAQTVTVGYERGRGMRRAHERSDGFYVSVSKTLPIGVNQLFEEFTNSTKRSRWLEPGTLRSRTSQPGKSARFDFRDDESRVHAYFTSKGNRKATVVVQHERLSDAGLWKRRARSGRNDSPGWRNEWSPDRRWSAPPGSVWHGTGTPDRQPTTGGRLCPPSPSNSDFGQGAWAAPHINGSPPSLKPLPLCVL